jgi:hypothetical protein
MCMCVKIDARTQADNVASSYIYLYTKFPRPKLSTRSAICMHVILLQIDSCDGARLLLSTAACGLLYYPRMKANVTE